MTLALALAAPAAAETPEEKGLAIAREADQRNEGYGDSRATLQMILRNRHGEESKREIRSRTLEVRGDGDRSLIVFDQPKDVAGTALLTYTHKKADDDRWLYLPALKRVKRIASSNKSGPFMGSEFAYEDLGSQEVEKYSYKHLRDERALADPPDHQPRVPSPLGVRGQQRRAAVPVGLAAVPAGLTLPGRRARPTVPSALLLLAAAALAAAPAHGQPVPVRGELLGQAVDTSVDSEIARYYVDGYLRGIRREPALDRRLDALHGDPAPPSRERLAAVAAEFSVDLAAAFYAERLLQDPRNRELQARFEAELAAVRAGRAAAVEAAPLILMAPGWLYVRQPETGADFARPRGVLRRLGLESARVQTEESGTIEDNARILADAIARYSAQGRDLILVSASKAGPEIGWALTLLEDERVAHRARAWVNIGGILQGSPLADRAMQWPLRWLVRVMALWQPWTFDSIRSMRTAPGRERFARWRRPAAMPVVNFMGVPFSGDVSPGAQDGYARMRPLGPNDGLTLLADSVAPASVTIVQLGLDHYYLDPEIDLKAAALARVALALPRSPAATPRAATR